MTDMPGSAHSTEHRKFFLQGNSSTGDLIMRTRETTHQAQKHTFAEVAENRTLIKVSNFIINLG